MSGSREAPAARLRVQALCSESEEFRLGPVDFELGPGEILGVFGPNGAGKSTLLRTLAGLEPSTSGTIVLAGRDISRLPTHQRGVGMVFQDLALFPQLTVRENLAYGPRAQRWPGPEVGRRVEELLVEFRLSGYADRRPAQLSGGEQQRVALARALAPRPRLLLFDEPLSSADREIRGSLQREIRSRVAAEGITAVYVTHDLEEGAAVASRMAFLRGGRWVREGLAADVRSDPRSRFVAEFLGFNVRRAGAGWVASHPTETEVVPPGTPNSTPGVLEDLVRDGELARLTIRLGNEGENAGTAVASVRWALRDDLHVGDSVGVRFRDARPLPAD